MRSPLEVWLVVLVSAAQGHYEFGQNVKSIHPELQLPGHIQIIDAEHFSLGNKNRYSPTLPPSQIKYFPPPEIPMMITDIPEERGHFLKRETFYSLDAHPTGLSSFDHEFIPNTNIRFSISNLGQSPEVLAAFWGSSGGTGGGAGEEFDNAPVVKKATGYGRHGSSSSESSSSSSSEECSHPEHNHGGLRPVPVAAPPPKPSSSRLYPSPYGQESGYGSIVPAASGAENGQHHQNVQSTKETERNVESELSLTKESVAPVRIPEAGPTTHGLEEESTSYGTDARTSPGTQPSLPSPPEKTASQLTSANIGPQASGRIQIEQRGNAAPETSPIGNQSGNYNRLTIAPAPQIPEYSLGGPSETSQPTGPLYNKQPAVAPHNPERTDVRAPSEATSTGQGSQPSTLSSGHPPSHGPLPPSAEGTPPESSHNGPSVENQPKSGISISAPSIMPQAPSYKQEQIPPSVMVEENPKSEPSLPSLRPSTSELAPPLPSAPIAPQGSIDVQASLYFPEPSQTYEPKTEPSSEAESKHRPSSETVPQSPHAPRGDEKSHWVAPSPSIAPSAPSVPLVPRPSSSNLPATVPITSSFNGARPQENVAPGPISETGMRSGYASVDPNEIPKQPYGEQNVPSNAKQPRVMTYPIQRPYRPTAHQPTSYNGGEALPPAYGPQAPSTFDGSNAGTQSAHQGGLSPPIIPAGPSTSVPSSGGYDFEEPSFVQEPAPAPLPGAVQGPAPVPGPAPAAVTAPAPILPTHGDGYDGFENFENMASGRVNPVHKPETAPVPSSIEQQSLVSPNLSPQPIAPASEDSQTYHPETPHSTVGNTAPVSAQGPTPHVQTQQSGQYQPSPEAIEPKTTSASEGATHLPLPSSPGGVPRPEAPLQPTAPHPSYGKEEEQVSSENRPLPAPNQPAPGSYEGKQAPNELDSAAVPSPVNAPSPSSPPHTALPTEYGETPKSAGSAPVPSPPVPTSSGGFPDNEASLPTNALTWPAVPSPSNSEAQPLALPTLEYPSPAPAPGPSAKGGYEESGGTSVGIPSGRARTSEEEQRGEESEAAALPPPSPAAGGYVETPSRVPAPALVPVAVSFPAPAPPPATPTASQSTYNPAPPQAPISGSGPVSLPAPSPSTSPAPVSPHGGYSQGGDTAAGIPYGGENTAETEVAPRPQPAGGYVESPAPAPVVLPAPAPSSAYISPPANVQSPPPAPAPIPVPASTSESAYVPAPSPAPVPPPLLGPPPAPTSAYVSRPAPAPVPAPAPGPAPLPPLARPQEIPYAITRRPPPPPVPEAEYSSGASEVNRPSTPAPAYVPAPSPAPAYVPAPAPAPAYVPAPAPAPAYVPAPAPAYVPAPAPAPAYVPAPAPAPAYVPAPAPAPAYVPASAPAPAYVPAPSPAPAYVPAPAPAYVPAPAPTPAPAYVPAPGPAPPPLPIPTGSQVEEEYHGPSGGGIQSGSSYVDENQERPVPEETDGSTYTDIEGDHEPIVSIGSSYVSGKVDHEVGVSPSVYPTLAPLPEQPMVPSAKRPRPKIQVLPSAYQTAHGGSSYIEGRTWTPQRPPLASRPPSLPLRPPPPPPPNPPFIPYNPLPIPQVGYTTSHTANIQRPAQFPTGGQCCGGNLFSSSGSICHPVNFGACKPQNNCGGCGSGCQSSCGGGRCGSQCRVGGGCRGCGGRRCGGCASGCGGGCASGCRGGCASRCGGCGSGCGGGGCGSGCGGGGCGSGCGGGGCGSGCGGGGCSSGCGGGGCGSGCGSGCGGGCGGGCSSGSGGGSGCSSSCGGGCGSGCGASCGSSGCGSGCSSTSSGCGGGCSGCSSGCGSGSGGACSGGSTSCGGCTSSCCQQSSCCCCKRKRSIELPSE